jgi:hypothetical protein
MTLAEYRDETAARIRRSVSATEAVQNVRNAAQALIDSNITPLGRRQFWVDLYEVLERGSGLHERQAASSLSNIIAAAQAAINSYLSQGQA